VLIPRWGFAGAVAANSAAQVLAAGWAFVAMARTHRCAFPATALARIAAVAVLALATSWAISARHSAIPGLAAAGIAGAAAFVAGSFVVRVVRAGEVLSLLTSTRRMLLTRATGA
jgi:hypothetical protein